MRVLFVSAALWLVACGIPSEDPALSRLATVQGQLTAPVSGDAWLFLYKPHEGPPGQPAVPLYATAISSERMLQEPRFVFANVAPNPLKLWGFVDSNGNFDPTVDVLSQPGRGDRVGAPQALNVQPGRVQSSDYEASTFVAHEPPAFEVVNLSSDDVQLDLSTANATPLTLKAFSGAGLDSKYTAFHLGLVDANNDGRPDDANGDGTPDLSLTLVLRWIPRPGQSARGTNIVVPLAFDPTPFLNELNGRLGVEVAVQQLQTYPLPQAASLTTDEHGVQQLRVAGAPPTGTYELLALAPGGQFWKIPNQLATRTPSQGVRFHFDRASP